MLVYSAEVEVVDAALYNLWRRVRLHLTLPLRLDLPELRALAVIIEQDKWVLVNESEDDLPVLAWIDFQGQGRSSLHTPVTCTLNHYHFMAHQLCERVLKQLFEAIEEHLRGRV